MRRLMTAALLGAALSMPAVLPAMAAGNPSPTGTGQPSQTCTSSTAPIEPGGAATAPGSAFNEVNGTANGIYANPDTQGGTSSGNTQVVAQYDVACFQVSQK